MGVDLRLHPMKYHTMDWWLGTESFSLDRDYELQFQVKRCASKLIPSTKRVQLYKDHGVSNTTEDAYGELLRYAEAGELAKCSLSKNASPWNRAAWEFIRNLPPETPVILWWH